MIATSKRRPATPLTVSEVPSSATEPFSAMKRASSAGASKVKVAMSAVSLRSTIVSDPIHVPADEMAAELVAELQRAFEVDPRAGLPCAERGARQRLRRRLDVEIGAVAVDAALDRRQAAAGA